MVLPALLLWQDIPDGEALKKELQSPETIIFSVGRERISVAGRVFYDTSIGRSEFDKMEETLAKRRSRERYQEVEGRPEYVRCWTHIFAEDGVHWHLIQMILMGAHSFGGVTRFALLSKERISDGSIAVFAPRDKPPKVHVRIRFCAGNELEAHRTNRKAHEERVSNAPVDALHLQIDGDPTVEKLEAGKEAEVFDRIAAAALKGGPVYLDIDGAVPFGKVLDLIRALRAKRLERVYVEPSPAWDRYWTGELMRVFDFDGAVLGTLPDGTVCSGQPSDTEPTLLDIQLSADLQHSLVTVGHAATSRQTVYHDGKSISVTTGGLTGVGMSPRGDRVIYAHGDEIRLNEKVLVTGGRNLGFVSFSGDGSRYAFVYQRDQKTILHVNGEEREMPSKPDSLRWSRDGKRFAYRINSALSEQQVVVDGKAGKAYARVGAIEFSPLGKLVYGATDGARCYRVEEGEERPVPALASGIWFSADGKQTAFAGRQGEREVAFLDGEPVGGYDAVSPLFREAAAFSPDGKHFAFSARQLGREILVIDGREMELDTDISPVRVLFDANAVVAVCLKHGVLYRKTIPLR